MTRLTSRQTEFIERVLSLRPRVAALDCDGTLWSGDAGEGFFSWEVKEGVVSEEIAQWARARYADYKAGLVDEDTMCGEMVTMHRGLREEIVQQACDTYFAHGIAANIFPEMQQLVERLRASGCDVWAVSSSCQWIIRSAMRYFGIPQNRILAAEVARYERRHHHRSPHSSSQRSGQGGGDSIRAQIVSRSQAPIAPSATRSGTARCSPCPNTPSPSTPIPI